MVAKPLFIFVFNWLSAAARSEASLSMFFCKAVSASMRLLVSFLMLSALVSIFFSLEAMRSSWLSSLSLLALMASVLFWILPAFVWMSFWFLAILASCSSCWPWMIPTFVFISPFNWSSAAWRSLISFWIAFLLAATAVSKAFRFWPTVLSALTMLPWPASVVLSIIPLVTFTGFIIGLFPFIVATFKVVPSRTTRFAAPTTEIPATVAPIKPAKTAVVNFFPDNFILVSSLSSFENRHIFVTVMND